MPTVITHSFVAVAALKAFAPGAGTIRFWLLSIACSVIPDADVIGFLFGIPYGHIIGHRGFMHSPFFGFLLGGIVTYVFFRKDKIFAKHWWVYFIYFSLLTTSHGILDALTNGGKGIALLSPFDNTRYFFPWTPIMVSPIGIKDFFSKYGLMVVMSELIWIWIPSLLIIVFSKRMRNAINKQVKFADD